MMFQRFSRWRHRVWARLKDNWEPTLALAAIVVSIVSLALAWSGIQQAEKNLKLAEVNTALAQKSMNLSEESVRLAREGIDLTRVAREKEDAAQIEEDRARRTAMAPYVMSFSNGGDLTFGLENHGLGPGFVYQADFVLRDRVYTFLLGEQPDDTVRRMKELVDAAIGRKNAPYSASTVTQPVPAGGSKTYLSFEDASSTSAQSNFDKFGSTVDLRVCYTNLLGDQTGFALTKPSVELPECPRPPRLYFYNDP